MIKLRVNDACKAIAEGLLKPMLQKKIDDILKKLNENDQGITWIIMMSGSKGSSPI